MTKESVIILLLAAILALATAQLMKCSYGERGSLTSTCYNATPTFFRTTSYRFDNLDETVRCLNCTLDTIAASSFDISGNQIINLDLTSSRIRTLRDSAFVGLIFLKNLFLHNNEISTIYNGTFRGIKKLEFLTFENNSLTNLVAGAFKELINLQTLNIKNNVISHIDQDAFTGLDQLKELNLELNILTSVDGIFNGLSTIKIITLRSNRLAEIKQEELLKLNPLIELDLSNNSLVSISDSAFLSLEHLESLNLSNNNLHGLEAGMFRGLGELEKLILSHNKISLKENFPKGAFNTLFNLREVDFSYNEIEILMTNQFANLPELRLLNVSHNLIRGLFHSGIFRLNSLHTLDVSYNKIDDIDYKSIENHMPRLSYLDIEHNPIPCQLIIEIDKHFENDNIRITGDKTIRNATSSCNVTEKFEKAAEKYVIDVDVPDNNYANSYVVYTFFFIIVVMIGALFFLQYRTERNISYSNGVGNQYRSQTHLITSSDLEARDDY